LWVLLLMKAPLLFSDSLFGEDALAETISRFGREPTLFIDVPFHGSFGKSSTSGFGWW
jgi:hypothetical protein